MADRFSTIVLLVEDGVQRDLALQVLRRLGADLRNVRILPLAAGRGAGEQRVREEFPKEVLAHRRAAARGRSLLLVMIDADRRTVAERLKDLDRSLEDTGVERRRGGDRIAILVPKRHVETWIRHLAVEKANEHDDYSNPPPTARDKATAAAHLVTGARARSAPDTWTPSLVAAHPELRRLLE